MSTAMLLIGFLGAIVCIVMLIVRAIKRNSLKPFAIGFAVCLVLFMAGGATMPGSDDSKNSTASAAEETKKPEEADDSEKTPAPKPKRVPGTAPASTPTPEAEIGSGPKKNPMSPSAFESITGLETGGESQSLDIDSVITLLRLTLAENFGDNNYDVTYDDTMITVNVWKDGIAAGAVYASVGEETNKEAWDFMVEGQSGLCLQIFRTINDAGLPQNVTLNVLNDVDKSKTLLTVLNGIVIYDAVNG